MTSNVRSRIAAWAILLSCIIAAPVAMLSKGQAGAANSAAKGQKQWSGFLTHKDHILVLKLYGPIMDQESGSSLFPQTDTAVAVKHKLRKAADNDNVKGVLLRINSPGGTIGMSQEVCEAVHALRDKGKPVVVSMGDVAASGGYYIASAADKIYADPGTLTGSIGVIMHLLNWQETEKKIGLVPAVIKSGAFKDIGSPDRPMTDEEKHLLQDICMDSYDQFVTAVAEGRKMDKEQVKKLADGRVYSGKQALKVKLIDELGSYDDALAGLQTTCKEKLKLKDDLPVDDDSSSVSMISQLLTGSGASLAGPFGSGVGALKDMIPMSVDPRFNKVPLWILQ